VPRDLKWSRIKGGAAAVVVSAIFFIAISSRADASSIVSATLDREGPITELHFGLDSPAPRLDLTTHGDELWIDLNRTASKIPAYPLSGRETGPIRTVRAFNPGGEHMRIVIEVIGKNDFAIAQHRDEIVLRIAPVGQVANLAAPVSSRREQPRAPSPRIKTPIAPPTTEIARIEPAPSRTYPVPIPPTTPALRGSLVMIDPGHGGYDPGTQSSSGILEKDVALEISRRVASALKARGVRAQLTRDSDDFISLPERTRRANAADADLFVSIHLNSSPSYDTTGIEVYYLNNTTDRATIRLARMENQSVAGASAPVDSNLNYILADLRQNYKANEAASLARMIDAQTVADLDSQLGFEVNPLGAKKGPFYVLVGAHMPAVLVECGFLSNSNEASRLNSGRYQDVLASGIAAAVVRYLSSEAEAGNL
jgi:N-acetylmuramoyl-L-alanine amidase